jgi:hypothetical protein
MSIEPLASTRALLDVAARVVWFKEPSAALADTAHFLAHVMTFGTVEDLAVLQAAVPRSALRDVLADPPAGVFDERSWADWNLVLERRSPAPPLPVRRFPT